MASNEELMEWLVNLRRDFHMHPETLYNENRTTARIQQVLEDLGVETYTFQDMTGVVGLIRGKSLGKTIALRADMDALPIQEMNQVPYRSKVDGCMHACGHDAHVTILLGVARRIMEQGLLTSRAGNVKLFFQPAEEGGAGAQRMIERGVLEDPRVDWILAAHMDPDLPVGTIGTHSRQSHASADTFVLKIQGRGGHGARPQQCIDPILAGAQLVVALQSVVSRSVDPLEAAVVSVCRFSSGTTSNVIPEVAELEGTIRALTEETRQALWRRIQEIVEGIDRAFGTISDASFKEGYPPCMNDHEVVHFIKQVAEDLFTRERVKELPPSTGAEDFAFFAQQRPSAIIRIGCSNEAKGITHPLHSAHFDIDEEALMIGTELFTTAVVRFLDQC